MKNSPESIKNLDKILNYGYSDTIGISDNTKKGAFMNPSANFLNKLLDFPEKSGIFQSVSQSVSQSSCARTL